MLDIKETEALIVEIDENLQRADLTALQRAQHVTERKKVWESLHPGAKHGGAPGNKGGGKGKAPAGIKVAESATLIDGEPVPSFVEDTARKTGAAERTVRVDVQIGVKLCKKAQTLLAGTPVEDRKTDLLRLSKLPPAEQVKLAQVIHDGKANTLDRAKKTLNAERVAAKPKPLPTGPFRVIVADPPWRFGNRGHKVPYQDMSLDDIKGLEVKGKTVKDIAEPDAILWLWTTNSHLSQAFAVAKAWGFTYKTLLTWDKVRIGVGDWLRGQTEHCLLCVRGKPSFDLKGQTTIIRETAGEHSIKPEAFYALVESLCPGSKVELFARKARPGWQAWGSEMPTADGPSSRK